MTETKKLIKTLIFSLILLFPYSTTVFSQFESYPELDWFTFETKHFHIVYHESAKRTANTVAKIAEEIYAPITSLYQYEPGDKVTFVISDISDIANGATDYFGNRIEIFASGMDFELRGTHNWLRNVVTHEFTHMIQLQAALKFTKNMPAIYLQWLNYEKERRPDILYGYPNVIVSLPISGTGVPAWLAEGTAQYQRQALGYDYWDAQRDMILRMYVLDDKMLTWGEMGQFSSYTSLKAESIYNSGFALVRYISEKYGEDKLKDISYKLGNLTNFSIDQAISDVLNIDGKTLYSNWKEYLKKDYNERIKDVRNNKIEGNIIEKKGFANYFPKFSPDGKSISYLSNQEYDYGRTSLYIYDIKSKTKKFIAGPVSTSYSWSPDSKKIIYSKRNSPPTLDGIVLFDIYIYDTESSTETRLTKDLRAYSPAFSNDGKKICYLINKDGTLNLHIKDMNTGNFSPLTTFKNGEQIYNPSFSPNDSMIIAEFSYHDSREIFLINTQTGEMEFIINQKNVDNRNPQFSKDGKTVYYSSNRTGIFNIYSYNLETKQSNQITNVLGGAFMPSIDSSNLVYSTYTSDGFKIALLENFTEIGPDNLISYKKPDVLVKKYENPSDSKQSKDNFDWQRLRNFDDFNVKINDSKSYKSLFTQLSIFPVLRFDNYTKDNNFLDAIKPGIYFYSDEVMTRFSIFGGAFINRKGERDLFLEFNYNNGVPFASEFFARKLGFKPDFTFSGINVTRKADAQLIAGLDTLTVGVNYNLFSFDAIMGFGIINLNHNMKIGYTLSNYNSAIDGFVLPQSGIFIRGSEESYFKSHDIFAEYNYESYEFNRNTDINPTGRKVNIRYDFEMSKIDPEYVYDQNSGTYLTVYQKNNLHKLDVNWFESFGLFNKKHTLSFKLRAATIFGPQVDNFYDLYASGLPGMKGYPFYSMGGNRVATINMTYRLPLFTNIDTRIPPFYLDKLYFSVYGDFGNAWYEKNTNLKDFKKDVGIELRLQAFNSYTFPTSVFINASYGFDKFTKNFRGQNVTYGQELRLYFGILFGFDLF